MGTELLPTATDAVAAAGLLGLSVESDNDVVSEIRRGLPSTALTLIEAKFGISRRDLADTLSIPLRTIARRTEGAKSRKSGAGTRRLPKRESDLVYRLARLFNFAVEALGSEESAGEWFKVENPALGNVPLKMLDTEVGAREVENVLGRIRFGDTFV